jgi:mRNA-degrading endonuclease toxin of MazEF toxin-antitoxin module
VTSKTKVNPFEVKLPDGYAVSGVDLSDQLSSLDWPSRQAMLIERVSSDVMAMLGILSGCQSLRDLYRYS